MGLFGGGNSKSSSTTSIDNSVQQIDSSKNTNNAGANIGNTDNSVTNITDGGAFAVAQGALDMGGEVLNTALNTSSKNYQAATDLTQTVNSSSLDFAQSALDAAVKSANDSMVNSSNLINKSLDVASTATQSDSTNTMQSVTKIGIALAVVFGIGFIMMGRNK